MNKATHKQFQKFIEAAEQEGVDAPTAAGIIHGAAYDLIRDQFGPRFALKWAMGMAKAALELEKDELAGAEARAAIKRLMN